MAGDVTTNEAERRFELRVDGELVGFLAYRTAGPSLVLVHTEVGEAHAGQGYGGRLVRGAIEAARAEGRTVIPTCAFAVAYLRRHPELHEAVDPRVRDRIRAGVTTARVRARLARGREGRRDPGRRPPGQT